MDGSDCFVAREFLSTHPTLYFKEIRVSPKLMVLPSGTLTQTLDLENFATAYRSSKCVIDLGGSSQRDKLDHRRSPRLTIAPSSDTRPLVYYSVSQALSTAVYLQQLILVVNERHIYVQSV